MMLMAGKKFTSKILIKVMKYYWLFEYSRIATWSGNQEKSGKTKKNDKSQVKMGVFEKSQEKFIKNIRFFQFKFTKFPTFISLPLVKN